MKTQDLKVKLENLPDTPLHVRQNLSVLVDLLQNMKGKPLDNSRIRECLFILEELVSSEELA